MCHAVAQPSHPPQPTYIKTPNSSCCCCYLVTKLCPTLCDPLDCSSSVHGISQARILEVGCHFLPPGYLPHPGIKLTSPALAGRFFTAELSRKSNSSYLSCIYKESWVPKNWCFWTVLLEKTLESPLDSKEIKPVNFKGNQSWIFTGRTDAEAETPILWPPGVKNWLIRKDPDAGKDWRQEKNGTTEDEMVGLHHWLDGHEFEQALGVVNGQGGLACCSPWGRKESDTTEWVNWTELHLVLSSLHFLDWQPKKWQVRTPFRD